MDATNAEILQTAVDRLKEALDWMHEAEIEQLATPEQIEIIVTLAQMASDTLEMRRASCTST